MLKIYYALPLLLSAGLTTLSANAQSDFQPGYVVRPAGDTVRGEIDYRDAHFNARQCRFRGAPGAAIETFSPAQLSGYGLRNQAKTYRALALPKPDSVAGPAPRYFFDALVSGPGNLYFLRDAERADRLFVATPSLPLTELIHRKVQVEREGRVYLEEQTAFRNTLAQALRNCAVAQSQLPTLPYDVRSLTKVVRSYNLCQAPLAAPPTVATQRLRPHLSVLLGYKTTSMSLIYSDQTFTSNMSFGPDGSPVGGLALNLPLTSFSRKLSLEVELFYEGQHYSQLFKDNYGTRTQYEIKLPSVRLPLLMRYTFPKGRVRPLLEAGPTLAYILKVSATVATTGGITGLPSKPVDLLPNNIRQIQEGLSAGIGAQFSTWQGRQAAVLVRYEGDTGWAYGQGISTSSNHFYGLLTLDLFKQ